MGLIQHLHLIRVHHLTRNGVHLRDVKRWLADLRGKDMPDGYVWSYKRRYKKGYLWQDLVDDDLITPISDNEYILKGSQITAPHFEKPPIKVEQNIEAGNYIELNPDSKTDNPANMLLEITEESSTDYICSDRSSTLTEEFDTMKLEDQQEKYCIINITKQKQVEEQRGDYKFDYILCCFNSNSPLRKKSINDDISKEIASGSSSKPPKSYTCGASNVFRNLITCRRVDTNDSVLVISNCYSHKTSHTNKQHLNGRKYDIKAETLGLSARVFGSSDQQLQQIKNKRRYVDGGYTSSKKKQHSELNEHKSISTAYKPMSEPKCSQCGKPFRPEKLHSHMKSCRGIKALTKTADTLC